MTLLCNSTRVLRNESDPKQSRVVESSSEHLWDVSNGNDIKTNVKLMNETSIKTPRSSLTRQREKLCHESAA